MTSEFARSGWNASATVAVMIAFGCVLSLPAQVHRKPDAPADVEELCSITFDKDTLRPARVENSASSCLREAAARLKTGPRKKLVLVGVKDPARDHELTGAGSDREEEDATGFDVRLEDLSAYRAVNTKWYLVHYLNADPMRILPTTDETYFAQSVTLYLVPASADFNHNFLGTTKTNEKSCTITPCYSPDEETLTAQRRPRILAGAVDGSPTEIEAEKRELAALQQHRQKPIDMDGSAGEAALTPLPPSPTPEHPATVSIIPQ
jgi:hypothetical protein